MKQIAAFALFLLPIPALAGQTEAQSCAASLSPPAQQIYAATAPHVTATTDLRSLVRKQTRSLVQSGEMSREVAKVNVRAAGRCLLKLQS